MNLKINIELIKLIKHKFLCCKYIDFILIIVLSFI